MVNFWKGWDKESRIVYITGLVLLVAAVLFFSFYFFSGVHSVIDWKVVSENEKIRIPLDTFSKGIFDFSVEADAYVVFSQLLGGDIQVNILASFAYFALLLLAFVLALTTFSFLNNWLYYAGTSAIMLYYIFQQPDILFTGFSFNKLIQISPVIFLGGTSYVFYAFARNVKFMPRFIIFLGISVVYFGLISFFSGTEYALLYVVNYGASVAVILAILFVFFVSFEIVYAFLYLISNNSGAGNRNGTLHFTIIFLLYMLNLVLQYLNNTRLIHLDLMYISPFIIFAISAVLGIWGFKERSVMFTKTLPFYPFGAVIYLCWAVIAFSTIGFYFATGNDPLVEVFEDVILFTHIGFGFGFFLYVAWNYNNWIDGNARVNKLIYSYQWVSFLTVYLTGCLVVLCLFFYSNMFVYRQAWAGYYNGVADVYFLEKQYGLAEEFYQRAEGYEFQNHKSNYSLATIYKNQGKINEAIAYYKKANLKKPSAYAYANIARLNYEKGKNLEAILDLKDGLLVFPASGELQNNLALMYEKLNFPDSSVFYLIKSEKIAAIPDVALANKVGLMAKYKVKFKEELPVPGTAFLPLQTNRLAYDKIHNLHNEMVFNPLVEADSILNSYTFAYINNYNLAHLSGTDSSRLDKLSFWAAKDTNLFYKTDITYIKSILKYYNGNPGEAVKMVDDLQLSDESSAGFYLNTLGLWTLKNNLPRFAADIFQKAYDKGNKISLMHRAIALSEAGMWQEAINQWNADEIKNDKNLAETAQRFYKMLSVNNFNMILVSDDPVKYAILHYKINSMEDDQLGNLFFSFKNKEYQLKAGLDLFDYYYKKSNNERCGEILETLKEDLAILENKSSYTFLKNKVGLRIFRYYVLQKDYPAILNGLDQVSLNEEDEPYKTYLKSLLAENNNNLAQAAEAYLLAIKKLPFDEEIVLRASEFFYTKQNDSKTAFNILLDGVGLNPYAPELYKAYCIQAVHYGIPSFAESGLNELKTLVSEKEYKDFLVKLEKEKAEFHRKLMGG